MTLCHVVDQFLNDNGLAHTSPAEQADLAAFDEWRDQIDDLDAGLEDLRLRLQIDEIRPLSMNRPTRRVLGNGRTIIHGVANHVEDSA